MFDYKTLRKTANSLIANFGAAITIKRDVGRRFDPTTGKYLTGLTTTNKLKGVRAQFTLREKSGQTVQEGDVRLLVQAGVIVPIINDNLTFDSVTYRVMSVMAESPSGTDVYYDLHCRS